MKPEQDTAAQIPRAWFGGRRFTGLLRVSDDLGDLDSGGDWVVAVTFEGAAVLAQFETVVEGPLFENAQAWAGPAASSWQSSLDETAYRDAVDRVRAHVADGTVYQANICRVLRAPLPAAAAAAAGGWAGTSDLLALAHLLQAGNPAPYFGYLHLPDQGVSIVSASPELYLRRDGHVVESSPIKGTGRTAADLLPKDVAENVMIVDLVRNDLSRVCETGSVEVSNFLALEQHPGLVHLVSTVTGQLNPQVGWQQLFDATFAPGSVTGAPKSSALRIISELEAVPRQFYCGAFGWVNATDSTAELAVAIRTFWLDGSNLCFGTGAGITIGSDPYGEWQETMLKAARLIGLASGMAQEQSHEERAAR